jgi:hypothetical protein
VTCTNLSPRVSPARDALGVSDMILLVRGCCLIGVTDGWVSFGVSAFKGACSC